MPFQPAFEETDDLASRVFRDPKKYAKQLARGLARGMVTAPADIGDLVAQSVPGGSDPGMGGMARALLDKSDALKGEGTTLESLGELASPMPPVGKAAALGSILVSGKRAEKAGLINPQQIIDAIRMWKGGRKSPEIMGQTGLYVSNPRVLTDKPIVQALLDNPMTSIKGPQGPFDRVSMADRLKAGDLQGFEELFKLYPELAAHKLTKIDDKGKDYLGALNPRTGEIELNFGHDATKADSGAIFGHEIEHGIQEVDKIPGGSSPEIANRIMGRADPVLQRRNDVLSSAMLARSLADEAGHTSRPIVGPASLRDVMNVWNANKASTKGAYPLTEEVATMAATRPLSDLQERQRLVSLLQEKVPSNPGDGYLKTAGETWARIVEGIINRPASEVRRAGDIHKFDRAGVKQEQMFDTDEYTLRALKNARFY